MRIELDFVRAPYKWDHRKRWQLRASLFAEDGQGEYHVSSDVVDLEDIADKLRENQTFEDEEGAAQ